MSNSCELLPVRGSFLDFSGPVEEIAELESKARYLEDGLMLVRDGRIESLLPFAEGLKALPDGLRIRDYRGKLIVPGLIDTHIHYPQTELVGAYGEQLLDWLNKYTFPTEGQYRDFDHASVISEFFLRQLLSNGTTTALVFCAVYPQSAEAFFEAAERQNMRVIAGKVLMDRNAPDYLLDTPQSGYDDSKALIEKWHNRGRLLYAVTPRFAPTSSPEQLEMASALMKEYPGVYMQTHLSENKSEVEWVKSLYPSNKNYLDVYASFGLTGPRSLFAHSIHLEEAEWRVFSETDSVISFCPTSNTFLGSGLFNLAQARKNKVRVGLATDIGGGTSFNQLVTLGEAYKVLQLQGYKFTPYEAIYTATLGSAQALSLDDKIGNFDKGKEADFVVLDLTSTPLAQLRYDNSKTLAEKLFVLTTIGDDRGIYRTYVSGRLAHARG
ncbi:MAG: guanine deaminase [Deltaproteobacteria bacterium]|nr:guanine deaminase [Deltaproteobacteria bacterium]